MSPLRTYEILAGKVTPALLLGIFNATLYLLLIPTVFGVPFVGSVLIFYMALFAYLIALIGSACWSRSSPARSSRPFLECS